MSNQRHTTIRAALTAGLFMLWLVAIGARAGYLQLFKAPWLSQKASVQYEREMTLRAKRGDIYDRHHEALAVSIESTS
ncbi:MAG: hypothetical protein HKP58_14925, partial [Desulfatitalea sp.]|nr:hypothetical protein [Desulfatitalea sp.]NNK01701.1 hypothetical protein [Desulfatitalea sp.]